MLWRLRTDIAVSIKRPCLPALASALKGSRKSMATTHVLRNHERCREQATTEVVGDADATRTYPPRHGFRTQQEDAPVWYSSRGAVADASIDALSDKFGDLECAVQVSPPRQASAVHHPERWILGPSPNIEYATSWRRRVQPVRKLLHTRLPSSILRPLVRPSHVIAATPRSRAPSSPACAVRRAAPLDPRSELLDVEQFTCLAEAQVMITGARTTDVSSMSRDFRCLRDSVRR